MVAEARGGFGGVLASLDVRWVNHPFRVVDCEFKPVQLTAARECGFSVPATVITNDGPSAHSFAEPVDRKWCTNLSEGGSIVTMTTI